MSDFPGVEYEHEKDHTPGVISRLEDEPITPVPVTEPNDDYALRSEALKTAMSTLPEGTSLSAILAGAGEVEAFLRGGGHEGTTALPEAGSGAPAAPEQGV